MTFLSGREVRTNPAARTAFFALAQQVFDLSFQNWYEQGWWGEHYIPYTFFEGGRAVANASANLIDTMDDGRPKRYIQIGTVMTHPDFRGLGLSRRLMTTLLTDWMERCDGIYLYANETVLDFYPKFGFIQAEEPAFQKMLTPSPVPFSRLDMDNPEHIKLLRRYYDRGNPFDACPVKDNFGLLMFYCGGPLKDCVYYSRQLDCVAVVEYGGGKMTCYELFCTAQADMGRMLAAIAHQDTRTVSLGFTPKDTAGWEILKSPSDEQLFVHEKKENPFRFGDRMMPLLSHA